MNKQSSGQWFIQTPSGSSDITVTLVSNKNVPRAICKVYACAFMITSRALVRFMFISHLSAPFVDFTSMILQVAIELAGTQRMEANITCGAPLLNAIIWYIHIWNFHNHYHLAALIDNHFENGNIYIYIYIYVCVCVFRTILYGFLWYWPI